MTQSLLRLKESGVVFMTGNVSPKIERTLLWDSGKLPKIQRQESQSEESEFATLKRLEIRQLLIQRRSNKSSWTELNKNQKWLKRRKMSKVMFCQRKNTFGLIRLQSNVTSSNRMESTKSSRWKRVKLFRLLICLLEKLPLSTSEWLFTFGGNKSLRSTFCTLKVFIIIEMAIRKVWL